MSKQWETAKHCHTALSFLLLNIQRMNQHQSTTAVSLSFEERAPFESISRSKRQKVTHAFPEDPTTQYNNNHENSLADSLSITAAPSQSPPANKPVSSTRTQFNTTTTTTGYENPEPSSYSPLLMMGTTPIQFDSLQWPGGGPAMTTNFDLNMTDLFQGSTWDPSVFDAFTQGQLPLPDDL